MKFLTALNLLGSHTPKLRVRLIHAGVELPLDRSQIDTYRDSLRPFGDRDPSIQGACVTCGRCARPTAEMEVPKLRRIHRPTRVEAVAVVPVAAPPTSRRPECVTVHG